MNMKKFLFMMTLFTVSMTSAQTVHESGVFDNTYVTVSTGIVNPTTNIDWFNNTRPQFGVEVGKSLTTLYTTGLEFKTAVNTTGTKTAFDEMSLLWLHKLNMTNAIYGYCPDARWDVNVVGGLGWGHDMVIRDNYGVVQAGIEVAYNINDTWSILAKPNIEWNHVNDGLNHSDLGLSIGVSYKFPNRGFTICDRDELYLDNQHLNAEINELRKQLNRQKAINASLNNKQHVCKVDTVVIDNAPIIGFIINSAELTPASDAYLFNIAQNHKTLVVKGYADAQTGNPEYNMELSKKRAEAVKAKLIEYGATDVKIEAYGDTVQPFADNDMNRVAIVVKE